MDQSELARYPGLHLRGSTYYVRKRVPVDLAHIEKREQIRLSLDASDKKIAIRRYSAKLAEIERAKGWLDTHQASPDGAFLRPGFNGAKT
jgi:hypothetical protein